MNTKLDLSFERVVDVKPELVWKAWTTPEYLKKWFTPAPWKTVHMNRGIALAELEIRC